MSECTGTNCAGCEAGRQHYKATGCTQPGCTADHDAPRPTERVGLTEALAEMVSKMPETAEWAAYIERILAARLAERDAEWVAKVEALADEWDDHAYKPECMDDGAICRDCTAATALRALVPADAPQALAAHDAEVRHVVHVTAEPVAEDAVWCEDCEEWVTSGEPERTTDAAQTLDQVKAEAAREACEGCGQPAVPGLLLPLCQSCKTDFEAWRADRIGGGTDV